MITQRAQLNFLRMAPRKVRLLSQSIKGLAVSEAEARLLLSPLRAKVPLLKLLRSSVANAKNSKSLNLDRLVIREIRVDEGPMLKRFLPRAMGRATPIHKKSSHVTILLAEGGISAPSRFKIAVSKKSKAKREQFKKNVEKERAKEDQREAKKKDASFMRRIFQRKSV